jgi:hypothetical protein
MALTKDKKVWPKKEKGAPARLGIVYGDLREDGFVFQFYDKKGNECWLSPDAILKRKESIKKYHWDHKGRITSYKAEWWKKNADRNKSKMRERLYGVKDHEFIEMWESQEGLCKICGNEMTISRIGYAIDHCHSTLNIRGLLCSPCNKGLGMFRDNPELLRQAAIYLEKSQITERVETC